MRTVAIKGGCHHILDSVFYSLLAMCFRSRFDGTCSYYLGTWYAKGQPNPVSRPVLMPTFGCMTDSQNLEGPDDTRTFNSEICTVSLRVLFCSRGVLRRVLKVEQPISGCLRIKIIDTFSTSAIKYVSPLQYLQPDNWYYHFSGRVSIPTIVGVAHMGLMSWSTLSLWIQGRYWLMWLFKLPYLLRIAGYSSMVFSYRSTSFAYTPTCVALFHFQLQFIWRI